MENEKYLYKDDSTVYTPKLNITYYNDSDSSYYFLKISNNLYGSPFVLSNYLMQYPIEDFLYPNYLKRAQSHNNYINEKFNVIIGSYHPTYGDYWEIYSDTVCIETDEGSEDVINHELSDIYEYIYRSDKNYDANEISKTYFSKEDITPENILKSVSDRFVFLKSREYYTETFNLVGFALVKGCYTFRITRQKNFFSYVITGSYRDEKQSIYMDTKEELPVEVGEYRLYSGEFSSNEITITFK